MQLDQKQLEYRDKLTATHEAGHAVVLLTQGAEIVVATIEPTALWSGHTLCAWPNDADENLEDELVNAVAGDEAVKLLFGTPGIEDLTEFTNSNWESTAAERADFLKKHPKVNNISDATAVKKVLDNPAPCETRSREQCHAAAAAEARAILLRRIDVLYTIADALVKHRELFWNQIPAVLRGDKNLPPPITTPPAHLCKKKVG